MLILVSDCLFLLYAFCLVFEMVNFMIMMHLYHCQGAARPGWSLGDRELGSQGDPREPSALTDRHHPPASDHREQSQVL